ncbi:glycerophosphodiester phosphodiesterase [Primorskyibacter sp. S87]|uniref:glycerophosphodiester phosphodiesterase n=1 Tax=Primorskyibacter sp. S87 TaxID=3415126 RepID=UPI003C7D15BE
MTDFPQLSGFRGGDGLVRLIGHRGARGVLPENTMPSFEFAVSVGAGALEFDVILTRDNIPVITHNHRLSSAATRDGNGDWLQGEEPSVADLTFAEIRELDVGGLDGQTVYGRRFPDQAFLTGLRIPALTDLLDLACQPENGDLHLLLELKSDPAEEIDSKARTDFVSTVVTQVRKRALEPRTILHSFDWNLLDECRRQAPDMPTSYLSQRPENSDDPGEDSSKAVGPDFETLSVSVPRAVADAGGQMWCPYFMDVTPDQVAEAHALGLLVSTWTVNEPDDIAAMVAAGVDGIVTDYPGRLQRCLLDMGYRWS